MDSTPLLRLILFILVGDLIIFGGFISYWMGKTRNMSQWVGFRTPSTLSNADVWEAVNKKAGLEIMIEGSRARYTQRPAHDQPPRLHSVDSGHPTGYSHKICP